MAFVTGDFTSRVAIPQTCITELSRLSAAGVWGCNGNHEIYAGEDDSAPVSGKGMRSPRPEHRDQPQRRQLQPLGVDTNAIT